MNQLQNIQAAGHMEIIWGFTALHLKVISLRTQGLTSRRTLFNAWLLRHHPEVGWRGIQNSSVFHLWGITKISWLKEYLVLVKNLPLNFFPGRTWGLVMSTPSYPQNVCFSYQKLKPPLVSSPVLWIQHLTRGFVMMMSTASPVVAMSPELALPCCHRAENETWMMMWAGDFRNGTFWPRLFPPLISCLAQITPYLAPAMPTATELPFS